MPRPSRAGSPPNTAGTRGGVRHRNRRSFLCFRRLCRTSSSSAHEHLIRNAIGVLQASHFSPQEELYPVWKELVAFMFIADFDNLFIGLIVKDMLSISFSLFLEDQSYAELSALFVFFFCLVFHGSGQGNSTLVTYFYVNTISNRARQSNIRLPTNCGERGI